MAISEHLEILKQGVEKWNRWRERNPQTKPDLSYVDFGLIEADFQNINFSHTNLKLADFSTSNLCEANFLGASLYRAQMHDAKLSYAIFKSADLFRTYLGCSILNFANFNGASLGETCFDRANLEFANFSESGIEGTDFTEANLSNANFDKAKIYDAKFLGTNLSGTKNLDSCHYEGPSFIDYRTIQKSRSLPIDFLRGCGLPDQLINFYLSSFIKQSKYQSCFISYSYADEEFAKKLYFDLQANGVRCWFAPENLKIGERIRSGIDENIQRYDKLLVIISEHSITSQWVEQEIETALKRERKTQKLVLLPIKLDKDIISADIGWANYIQNSRNIGDFSGWLQPNHYTKALDRLLRDLKI